MRIQIALLSILVIAGLLTVLAIAFSLPPEIPEIISCVDPIDNHTW